jgi:leader peptidase (prepilin peptidase)/N-methyltransferase
VIPLLALIAVLGLLLGSFVNVVIHRVPGGESLVSPASRCPACAAPIRPWHNVPVLSWLWLRGRCADCAAPISVRYPLVELTTAVLFVAVAVRLDQLDLRGALPAYLYFATIGVALAFIDLAHHRLPDAIVLPSYPVLAILLGATALVSSDWSALARAGIGAAVLFGGFLVIAVVFPSAMGLGDVKFAGLVGGVLGFLSWSTLLLGAFSGFLLGAIYGTVLMLRGRGTRRTAIAFGPFMVAGAWVGVFLGGPVSRLYWDAVVGY